MKEKWLKKLFFIVIGLFILLAIINDFFIERSQISTLYNYNLLALIIYICLVAPFIEEISFRGVLKKRIFILFFVLLNCIYIVYNKNYIHFILVVLFLILYIKKVNSKAIIITNALVFVFAHYKITDLYGDSFVLKFNYLILLHFSLAIILSYITINYNLLKAILFHIVYNTITIAFFLYPLFISQNTLKSGNIEGSNYIFAEKYYSLTNEKEIIQTINGIELKNTSIIDIDKFIFEKKLTQKYKFNIHPYQILYIKVSDNNNSKTNEEIIINILLRHNVIEKL